MVESVAGLKTWICNASNDESAMAEAARDDGRTRERDTAIVNSLGTTAIVINAGAAFAAAATLLFLPTMSLAACAASAAAGAVAQRRKPGKPKPAPGTGGSGRGWLRGPRKGGGWWKRP